MRVLWSKLSASRLIVQMDNLFHGISNEIVIFWFVTNDHVLIKFDYKKSTEKSKFQDVGRFVHFDSNGNVYRQNH